MNPTQGLYGNFMLNKTFLKRSGFVILLLAGLEVIILRSFFNNMDAGVAIKLFFAAFVFFHIATGIGLLFQQKWGVLLFKIFLYILLPSFPIGTIIAWSCLKRIKINKAVNQVALCGECSPHDISYLTRRCSAFLVDIAIVSFLSLVLSGSFVIRYDFLITQQWLAGMAVFIAYFTIMESGWCGGCSLGKMLFGLSVVRTEDENYSGLARTFIRTILLGMLLYSRNIYVTLWPETQLGSLMSVGNIEYLKINAFLFLGYLVFGLIHPKGLMLHDLMSGTHVITKGRRLVADGGGFGNKTRSFMAWLFIVVGVLATAGLYAMNYNTSESASRFYNQIYLHVRSKYPAIKHMSASFNNSDQLNIYMDTPLNKYPSLQDQQQWGQGFQNDVSVMIGELNYVGDVNFILRSGYNMGILSMVFVRSIQM